MVKTIGIRKGDRKQTGCINRDIAVTGIGNRYSGSTTVVDGHDTVTGVGRSKQLAVINDVDRTGTVFSNRNMAAIVLDVDSAAGSCGCDHISRVGAGYGNARNDRWYYDNRWHNNWWNYNNRGINRYNGCSGDVDVGVDQGNRCVQGQCSAVQCYHVDVTGGRGRDA